MVNEYNFNDIISAFEFGKKNPGSEIQEWLDKNSRTLSQKDLEYYNKRDCKYKNIEIEIKGVKHELVLLTSESTEALERLTIKLAGDKGYYKMEPMPGEWYPPYTCLFSTDNEFFNLNIWDDHPEFNGVKYLSREPFLFMYDLDCSGWEEMDFDRYEFLKSGLEKEKLALWHYDSRLMVYIDKDHNFNFEPIKNLFILDPNHK